MHSSETASTLLDEKRVGEPPNLDGVKDANGVRHRAQFIAAHDSRNRRVPGPYVRYGRFYTQLWVVVGNGRKAPRRIPLFNLDGHPTRTLQVAKEAPETKRCERRQKTLALLFDLRHGGHRLHDNCWVARPQERWHFSGQSVRPSPGRPSSQRGEAPRLRVSFAQIGTRWAGFATQSPQHSLQAFHELPRKRLDRAISRGFMQLCRPI